MSEKIARDDWQSFLKTYTDENGGRPTRLGVFERLDGVVNDFWVEDGMPLLGVDIDNRDNSSNLEIVLGSYTHSVADPAEIFSVRNSDTGEEGLDITDSRGSTTVLRFEQMP